MLFQKRKTSRQKEDAHEGERLNTNCISLSSHTEFSATYDHSQCSSAFGVDEEQSGDGKDDLNSAITQRRIQGLRGRVAHILEDG